MEFVNNLNRDLAETYEPKKFWDPRYVADLGGPPLVRKKMKKIYNIGQLFEGKKSTLQSYYLKLKIFK